MELAAKAAPDGYPLAPETVGMMLLAKAKLTIPLLLE